MKIIRLYIKNFMCYNHAYIDFGEFSSALIVGKKENNDDVSNGVGKTTIFKAIEYAFFNHSDVNLENIIRDDEDLCSITVDFNVNDQDYRVTRTRTNKGVTDLTLFKRTASDGQDTEILHAIHGDNYSPLSEKKFWEDISGRRSADTEKELAKLIKVNIKLFRIFVHFMQNDFSGLTTATPEKRKIILRDALNLVIYSKLEKIVKDKANTLSKEADKYITMIDALGNLDQFIVSLSEKLLITDSELAGSVLKLTDLEILQSDLTDKINILVAEHKNLEAKLASSLIKEQSLLAEKNRLEISVKEYTTKKSNVIKIAKDLILEIKNLEETQSKLVDIDFGQIDILTEQIISNREQVAQRKLSIKNDTARCEKLRKPIPKDGECEECRQVITDEHRKLCQGKLDAEHRELKVNLQNCSAIIDNLNNSIVSHQQNINSLVLSKQQLESVNTQVILKKTEIADKRILHEEYSSTLQKHTLNLEEKNKEIELITEELKNSSINEAKELQNKIQMERQNLNTIVGQISNLNKEISIVNNKKAVLQHDLKQKTDDKNKKVKYNLILKELENKLVMYPSVIQAYSSAGIPNLITQNILDDLQVESNALLNQIKPGIQLSFFVEKIKGDGTEADTLDINYLVNGKKRYYEQLSGAMKLAVTFSLKLGLSFILQKIIGVDIKLLLLDEIDQSLDKASIDAFTEIVKFFSNDFTILVITHNDRLKDKFNSAILVEQDINMVSTAKVVSSW